jgi:hypothetical protein
MGFVVLDHSLWDRVNDGMSIDFIQAAADRSGYVTLSSILAKIIPAKIV